MYSFALVDVYTKEILHSMQLLKLPVRESLEFVQGENTLEKMFPQIEMFLSCIAFFRIIPFEFAEFF